MNFERKWQFATPTVGTTGAVAGPLSGTMAAWQMQILGSGLGDEEATVAIEVTNTPEVAESWVEFGRLYAKVPTAQSSAADSLVGEGPWLYWRPKFLLTNGFGVAGDVFVSVVKQ